jgi:hypothetical protein
LIITVEEIGLIAEAISAGLDDVFESTQVAVQRTAAGS